MPFRRRNRRKNRRFKRRFKRRRGMSNHLDPEKKDIGHVLIGSNITTTGTLRPLNEIPQGTDVSSRQGRQALMLSIFMRLNISQGAVNVPQFTKVWLIHQKQPRGVNLGMGDFLQDPVVPTVSPRNKDSLGAYQVLWSKKFVTDPFNAGVMATVNRKFRIKTRWDLGDANGLIAAMQTGALWLVYASDQAANFPTITFDLRLNFTG